MAEPIDDPRLPKTKSIKVGVFPFGKNYDAGRKPTQFNAYTTWYNSEWKGCCEHTIEAVNGTEAKKLAIAEHKENCRG